jgi:hypothetical protein
MKQFSQIGMKATYGAHALICNVRMYQVNPMEKGQQMSIDPHEIIEGYQGTVKRLEPDIHMIDAGAFYASAAISLKRIADAYETMLESEHIRRKREFEAAHYGAKQALIKANAPWWKRIFY